MVVLFHTKEMSGFFPEITNEVKQIFLADILVRLSSLEKNPAIIYFPKG